MLLGRRLLFWKSHSHSSPQGPGRGQAPSARLAVIAMRLPLLDMRRWHESPAAFAQELRIACHRFGFFQLRHRIPDHVAERAMNEARRFFARPVEEKQRIGYGSSSAFRGYMAYGVENTAGKPDLREQVEIAAEGLPAAARAWPTGWAPQA